MRKLLELGTPEELDRLTELMHAKGIPTYARSCRGRFGGSPWILYACLDSQGNDAIALLRDPEHDVANPVDVESFDRATQRSNFGLMLGWSVGFIVLAASLLWLAVYFLF